MLEINFLKNSGFFTEHHLDKNEVLFDEGEIDNNIYIVTAGELGVEKYTTKKREQTKLLAKLSTNDIFGEAALNNNDQKQVKIVAKRETILLSINAREGFDSFSKKYPEQGGNLLKYIIYISNKRLLESNELITANYKITQEILKIETINNKNIFGLINKLENIIHIDHTLFLEKNPVLENYLVIKYDSREIGKMQDKIIEVTDSRLDLLELTLNNTYHNIQTLSLGEEDLGYLIYFRQNKDFSENDKKILSSISIGISGIIKEKKRLEEQNNRNYMES